MGDFTFTTDTRVDVFSTPTLILPANGDAVFRKISRESKLGGPNLRISFGGARQWEDAKAFGLSWESSSEKKDAVFQGEVWMLHNAAGQTVQVYAQEAEDD